MKSRVYIVAGGSIILLIIFVTLYFLIPIVPKELQGDWHRISYNKENKIDFPTAADVRQWRWDGTATWRVSSNKFTLAPHRGARLIMPVDKVISTGMSDGNETYRMKLDGGSRYLEVVYVVTDMGKCVATRRLKPKYDAEKDVAYLAPEDLYGGDENNGVELFFIDKY